MNQMAEACDLPASALTAPKIENGASSCMRNNIRNDVVAGQDYVSSYQPWDSLKCKADTCSPYLENENDYQVHSSESCCANTYSKEDMPSGSGYHRQQSCFSSSNCSWESSSSTVESVPSTPDASGNVVGKMRIKSKIFQPRPYLLAPYPSTGPDTRRSDSTEVKACFSLDYQSKHQYRRSDRSTVISNCNSQSIERHSEIVDIPRGAHCVDETTSSSSQWYFHNRGPSLPRGLQYGDEIPSLSSWNYGAKIPSHSSRQAYGDEIPSLSGCCNSLSSKQSYGDEIPSLSRHRNSLSNGQSYCDEIPSLSCRCNLLSSRQSYGDEIPSLSHHQRCQDRIPLHRRQWYHGAEAHPLLSHQRGASHGNAHSRDSFRSNGTQRANMTTSRHTVTRPDHYRTNKKDNTLRNSEDTMEQVCGPRANKLKNSSTSKTEKDIISPLVRRDQFNRSDFSVQYEQAKFFMIKSYSEDDIHKAVKYNVWASTANGNNKLDAAFHEAQILMKEKGKKCPVFLFFSVNSSMQFVGLAEILGPVDFKKTMDFWRQDKWNGFFPVMWHIIKDIPNKLFRHITLENNFDRPVTYSKDTQEIGLPQGLEMLKIFKDYHQETSLLDDFNFYEEMERTKCAKKGRNADLTDEANVLFFGTGARLSDDFKSMENLEASMESTRL